MRYYRKVNNSAGMQKPNIKLNMNDSGEGLRRMGSCDEVLLRTEDSGLWRMEECGSARGGEKIQSI
jgi:hypothetical protein